MNGFRIVNTVYDITDDLDTTIQSNIDGSITQVSDDLKTEIENSITQASATTTANLNSRIPPAMRTLNGYCDLSVIDPTTYNEENFVEIPVVMPFLLDAPFFNEGGIILFNRLFMSPNTFVDADYTGIELLLASFKADGTLQNLNYVNVNDMLANPQGNGSNDGLNYMYYIESNSSGLILRVINNNVVKSPITGVVNVLLTYCTPV